MLLSHSATPNRVYEIKVFKNDGTYLIVDYVHGDITGIPVGYTDIHKLYKDLCNKIYYASIYDGLKYEVVGDSFILLSLEMMSAQ